MAADYQAIAQQLAREHAAGQNFHPLAPEQGIGTSMPATPCSAPSWP
jgi:hypothetical protein